MKYIIFEVTYSDGRIGRMPFLFPEHEVIHSEMAKAVEHLVLRVADEFRELGMRYVTRIEPVNAGFCSVKVVDCHGKSESLGLSSGAFDESTVRGT